MPRFAANLSMLFTEVPFLDRFAAAAKAGFKGVEFLFPYAFDVDDIRARLDQLGLEVVLFEDEAKGRIFSRNKAQKIEFLKEPAGSSADMVVRHVCRK